MSAPMQSFDPTLHVREPAWWRTVAWPQVVTLVGIGLAVLAPIVVGLLLAV